MAHESELDAPIVEVTVFHNGARVVRRGTVALAAGTATAVLGNLPTSMDTDSARVVARGAGIALRDVEVKRLFQANPARDETRHLRQEVDRLELEVQALKDEDAAEEARLTFLEHLSEAAATAFARAVGFGRAEHAELGRMGDELAAGTASALERRRDIASRRRQAKRELEAAERRLAAADSSITEAVELVELRATLEVEQPTRVELEVTYHVHGASWRPLYDMRLEDEKLRLDYLAEVSQLSGEDWPEVPLVLSTSRRGRHSVLPELHPWYVGKVAPLHRAPRAAASKRSPGWAEEEAATPAPMAGAGAGAMAFSEAAPMLAQAEESGAALVYRVQAPIAVPADGAPRKTTVARLELDAKLDHLTVPALAPEAYLRATVTNDSEVMLLPGAANVFHEEEFVGQTRLETVAPGEELEVQLGVDDRVRVERELRRRTVGKAVLGGTRSVDVAYEITVENHRRSPARVTVNDHYPVSRDGEVKVRLRDCSPKASEQDDLGQLTWELSLDAGGKAAVRFSFSVEHPASVQLYGL
jgi:uncharacterized protein (TIGR02231 family)